MKKFEYPVIRVKTFSSNITMELSNTTARGSAYVSPSINITTVKMNSLKLN